MAAPYQGRVAITGAGGFLGQLARAECEALGYEVRGIDLAQPKCQGGPRVAAARVADSSKVDVVIEDMSCEGSMTGVLEGCQSVIHLAADGRPSADFMADVLPSNIQATFHLLKEAERAKVKRVIFASTNHAQHGATMGDHPGRMSWTKLQQLGGAASICLSDPLGRTGPDSFYAVSKVFGEALGYLFSRVHESFEFVALRIGWCLYEKPTDLKGDECEDYLRCMFLSQRDFKGFLRAALQRDLARHQGFLIAYAVSRNGLRSFDLQETIETLGYHPVDDAEESPPEWLSHFVSGEVAHTANLFCSLMATICSYDPVGRGLPYGSFFSGGLQEEMVDKALQILCVALDFQPKEDEDKDAEPFEATWFLVDNSQLQAQSYGLGYRGSKDLDDLVPSKAAVWGEKVPGHDRGDGWIQVGDFYLPEELEGKRVLVAQDAEDQMHAMRKPGNVYRYMLQHVSKENEIDLVFTGLLRLLSSVHQAEQTILPHSMRSVGFYQEALVLLWHVLTLNPTFTKRVVDRHDSNQFLLSLIFLLQQAQKSVHLVGLLHTASFVLLVLSSERAFSVRLNEPYVAKRVPLDVQSFSGNHADVLALSLYKVISESLGKPQNDALVEMLLTALCNVSPYVKSFCLESCLKLVSLAERLSRPGYFFRTAFTHHGLVFLVELLNNIVQYQYEGNTMMVYAVLRQAEVFNKIDRLSLADCKKPPTQDSSDEAKKWEATEEWMQGVKKKLPLQTLQCLIEYLNPQLEVLCVEKEVTDQQEVLRFLKATTLVGILPVPHPIVIRTYQASPYTAMWFTSYMWGVIFTRSQRMPLYDWKKIRLVTINN